MRTQPSFGQDCFTLWCKQTEYQQQIVAAQAAVEEA